MDQDKVIPSTVAAIFVTSGLIALLFWRRVVVKRESLGLERLGCTSIVERTSGRVTGLYIHGNACTRTDVSIVLDFTKLRRLQMDYTCIGDVGFSELCSRLAVEWLTLDDKVLSANALSAIRFVKSIEYLRIRAQGADDSTLSAIGELQTLRHLSIDMFSGQFSNAAISNLRVAIPQCRVEINVLPDDRTQGKE